MNIFDPSLRIPALPTKTSVCAGQRVCASRSSPASTESAEKGRQRRGQQAGRFRGGGLFMDWRWRQVPPLTVVVPFLVHTAPLGRPDESMPPKATPSQNALWMLIPYSMTGSDRRLNASHVHARSVQKVSHGGFAQLETFPRLCLQVSKKRLTSSASSSHAMLRRRVPHSSTWRLGPPPSRCTACMIAISPLGSSSC